MADDKKNIPEAAPPAEAPAPAVENTGVPEQPAPEPALTDAETVMLEHEGQAALFEMGEAMPDPADAVTHTEVDEPAAPEVPKAEKEQAQPPDPGKDDPAPAHSGKVVDFAAARDEEAKEEKKAVKQKPPTEKDKAAKPGRGRPSKDGKTAPDKHKPPKPRDKKSQSKPAPEKPAVDKGGAPAGAEVTPEPSAPRDATRAEKEEIVYLNLSDLHPFKNHPFGVRDDAEMQGLVESVKAAGVNQPALVRPREDGGYEIIAGHRRQRASELAGFANMPCIVRNMTDDEAILAMTDDNLRHRERILPTEKAQSLKMQVEAIKHQGSRPGEEDKDAGKRSTQVVGDRNGMNYKQVQRYIRLTELVQDLQKMVDEKKLAFTPAVEISFIRPKNQRYIAVSIEGQQSSPSLSQAQKMRELDKDGKLNGDVIDGILSQEKKEVDKVIINSAELEKYFGKDKSPREMKDKIISLLPNIPYVFIGWVFLKLGTAYRLAAGDDFVHKFIGLGQTVGAAFADFAPGLAPFDWLVGIVGAAAFRLLIYFKSKNAKKFRRDAEYGSARWGNEKDIKPFVDSKFEKDIFLGYAETNTEPCKYTLEDLSFFKSKELIVGTISHELILHVYPPNKSFEQSILPLGEWEYLEYKAPILL